MLNRFREKLEERRINLPPDVWNAFIDEISSLESVQKYERIKMKDLDYGWFETVDNEIRLKKAAKTVVSYWKNQGVIHRPTKIQKVGSYYYVASQYQRIAKFDTNWNFLGWVGYWADFDDESVSNGYVNAYSFYIDESEDRLYVLSSRHILRVFRFSTLEKLFDIGVFDLPGDPEYSKLNCPRDIKIIDNKIVISSYNGKLNEGKGQGFVASYDKSDGSLLEVNLSFSSQGLPELREIRYPSKMYLRSDDLYICVPPLNYVAVFDTNFNFKRVYKVPVNSPHCCYVDSSGKLFVGCPHSIVVFDAEGNLINIFGSAKYEDYRENKETLGGFANIFDILVDEEKQTLIVLDYSNNRIQEIALDIIENCQGQVKLQLEEVENKNFKLSFPYDIDRESWSIVVDSQEILSQPKLSDIYLIY